MEHLISFTETWGDPNPSNSWNYDTLCVAFKFVDIFSASVVQIYWLQEKNHLGIEHVAMSAGYNPRMLLSTNQNNLPSTSTQPRNFENCLNSFSSIAYYFLGFTSYKTRGSLEAEDTLRASLIWIGGVDNG